MNKYERAIEALKEIAYKLDEYTGGPECLEKDALNIALEALEILED